MMTLDEMCGAKKKMANLLVRRSSQGDSVAGYVKAFVFEIIGHGPICSGPMAIAATARWAGPRLASRSLRVIVLLTTAAKRKKEKHLALKGFADKKDRTIKRKTI